MITLTVAVIGATGGTGAAVIENALAAGHNVIAVARRPEAVKIKHARLEIRRADVLEPESLFPALAGANAIVSAIGTKRAAAPTRFYSDGITNLIRAMKEARQRRLISVGASGYIDEPHHPLSLKLMMSYLVRPILRHTYDDLQRMEEIVKASKLDWTIVRPPRLTNGRRTEIYRVRKETVIGGAKIARRDAADYIVKILDAPDALRKSFGIAY